MSELQIHRNFSLRAFNTFNIDVLCSAFAQIPTIDALSAVLQHGELGAMPRLILGGGSNLLFTKDFDGLALKVAIEGIYTLRENDDFVWVKAGAGERWHNLVLHCVENRWGGIENLSLIPGCVGAAPIQNIGAYGAELKEVFDSLEAVNLASGKIEVFTNAQCRFGYRDSIFKNKLKDKYCIVSVTLCLHKHPLLNTQYGAIDHTLKEMGVAQPTLKTVSEAVCHIRRSKLPNPAVIGNAGSFFKNAEVDKEVFDVLHAHHPAMPHYRLTNGKVKIPAGWLIEQCGWKGKRNGQAGVHHRQALVLVNYGTATGDEILSLAHNIQASVKKQFGIALMPEVNVV